MDNSCSNNRRKISGLVAARRRRKKKYKTTRPPWNHQCKIQDVRFYANEYFLDRNCIASAAASTINLATMIGRKIVWTSFVMVFFALGGNAENEVWEDIFRATNDLVPTYRTPLESFAVGLLAPDNTANDSKIGAFITSFVHAHMKPLPKIINWFKEIMEKSYPGTLWCGNGSATDDDDKLGLFKRTDRCCRIHDKCESNIAAGKSDHGLLNNGIFTRSECSCDDSFYQCLKNVTLPEKIVAMKVGFTYFNLLRPQCFALRHPILSCAKRDKKWFLREKKCKEYKLDYDNEKKIQWFDNPDW